MSDGAGPERHLGDEGLQPQRTDLAWRRTSLSLAGASAAAGKVLEARLGGISWAIAIVGIVLASGLSASAHRRGRSAVVGGRLVTTCAALVVVLGAAALVFVAVPHGA